MDIQRHCGVRFLKSNDKERIKVESFYIIKWLNYLLWIKYHIFGGNYHLSKLISSVNFM